MPSPFHTTRWSLVQSAGRADAAGRAALSELCEHYWPPVHAFLLQKCGDRELAKDLTQGFFLDLLAREDLATADPARGRFRSFLLKCAQNFAAKQHARDTAQKRGGAKLPMSLEALQGEDGEARLAIDTDTPAAAFERRWVKALLDRVLQQLQADYEARGRGDVFVALQPYLESTGESEPYAAAAQRLEMTSAAIKVNVHRLRQRFRELLLAEVAETVQHGGDVLDEVRCLQQALRRPDAGRARFSANAVTEP